MKKNMRKKLLKFSLFSLLLCTIFITFLIVNLKIKAVPTSSIPTGYIPYRSEYTALYFGENLDNEVYFDTSVSISVPSLSKNVYTTLSTGGWFTYNNVRYNSLYVNRRENGETGVELATVRFYNTASDDLSQNILTYDYSLGTYKFSWSTEIKNASPTIIIEDNVRFYNASSTAEGTSILNDILFNAMYVKYIPDATNYDITLTANLNYLDPSNYPNEEIFYYTNNNDSSSNLLTALDLPYISQGNSIKFVNNSTNYQLYVSFDNISNSYILDYGESTYWITIESNTVVELGLRSNTLNVRLDELSQEDFVSILTNESEADNIKYSINDVSTLYTLPKPDFPRTLENINSITIYNNSSLELGILASHDDSFRILAPGISYEYTIIENTTLYFGFKENSTNDFQIEGYYYFNDNITFPPDDLSQFSFIANLSGNEYEYMRFDSTNNSLWYYGDESLGIDDIRAWYSLSGGSKLYYEDWASIDLFISPTTVNESTYNWLNDNGTWGYWTPPDDNPNLDFSVGTFVIDSLDNFLAFEIYQGFSLLQLLYLVIAIPLLTYILKLFMGG